MGDCYHKVYYYVDDCDFRAPYDEWCRYWTDRIDGVESCDYQNETVQEQCEASLERHKLKDEYCDAPPCYDYVIIEKKGPPLSKLFTYTPRRVWIM